MNCQVRTMCYVSRMLVKLRV